MINTNEIVKSVINTSFTTVKFVHLHSIIHAFERVVHRSYIVAKACASPRNSTWFTRLFLLVKGWGLGTRLRERCHSKITLETMRQGEQLLNYELENTHEYLAIMPHDAV